MSIVRARVVQVAIIEADALGRELRSWSALVRSHLQEGNLPFQPSSAADVEASSFAEIAGEVTRRLDGRTLVAHNAAFDVHLLIKELGRVGVAWRPRDVVCTLLLVQARYPSLDRYDLAHLAERLDLPQPVHDALADARATLALYRLLTTPRAVGSERAVDERG